jgi:hypothetical protein
MDHRSFLELRIRIGNCEIISIKLPFSAGCHQAWIIAASYSWWSSRAVWSSVGTSSQLRIKVGTVAKEYSRNWCCGSGSGSWILIHGIHMFLGLMDPDLSIIK